MEKFVDSEKLEYSCWFFKLSGELEKLVKTYTREKRGAEHSETLNFERISKIIFSNAVARNLRLHKNETSELI